jgi:hypothetical protein
MRRTLKRMGLYEQSAHLKLHWPNFRTCVKLGTLTTVGAVRPTLLSDTYTVKILVKGHRPPDVRVINPVLSSRTDDTRIPHMYDQERLCLYTPGFREWSPEEPIATTILPWCALWLHYYELWHSTGEWLGGGHEPSDFQALTLDDGKRRDPPKPR